MKTNNILLAALMATVFAPALAEEAAPEPVQRHVVVTRELSELSALEGMRFAGPGMRMHGKPVKGAPYSAEVVSERQQNLADGNQIINKTTSASYRDSAGRTRQEVRDQNGEIMTITIHDPVDGTTWVLNPRDKTATKIAINKEAMNAWSEAGKAAAEAGKVAAEAGRAATGAAHERIEQMRKEGKLPAERKEIIIRRFEGPDGERMDMKVMPNGREMAMRLAPLVGAFGDSKWGAKAITKDLGTREIEGVKAEGKLRSYEIPAGEIGNRNPIVVADETWYSPELQVTVLSKHTDPRSGDSVYRLSGLKREEPAAALFTVPSDYTVKDVMANVKRMMEKKAP